MKSFRWIWGLIGIFCLWNCAQETTFVPLPPVLTPETDSLPKPHQTLSPQEVVQIQLEALKNNAEWGNDRGIGICFQFASPKNPISTGSLNRFMQIYQPMLNARSYQQSPMKIEGDSAIQKGLDNDVVVAEEKVSDLEKRLADLN